MALIEALVSRLSSLVSRRDRVLLGSARERRDFEADDFSGTLRVGENVSREGSSISFI